MISKNILENTNIDALIVKNSSDIFYISNIEINNIEHEGYLIIDNDKVTIITDGRYEQDILMTNPDVNLIIIKRGTTYISNLIDFIREEKYSTIAANFNNLTVNENNIFIENNINLIHNEDLISNLRQIKNDVEKNIIREAYQITNNLWDHISKFVNIGMKESEIVLEMYNYIIKNGGTGFSFNPIIASGINSTKPHASWTNKVIENGDIMTLDFGIKYKNYCTDVTKNIAFGDVDQQLLDIYEICYEANEIASNLVKDGFSIEELDNKSRGFIDSKGYGEFYNHGLGHGLGLDVHEFPSLGKSKNTLIKDELITIEPGIYLPNIGGVRVESAGFVTKDGFECLSNSRKLIHIK